MTSMLKVFTLFLASSMLLHVMLVGVVSLLGIKQWFTYTDTASAVSFLLMLILAYDANERG